MVTQPFIGKGYLAAWWGTDFMVDYFSLCADLGDDLH